MYTCLTACRNIAQLTLEDQGQFFLVMLQLFVKFELSRFTRPNILNTDHAPICDFGHQNSVNLERVKLETKFGTRIDVGKLIQWYQWNGRCLLNASNMSSRYRITAIVSDLTRKLCRLLVFRPPPTPSVRLGALRRNRYSSFWLGISHVIWESFRKGYVGFPTSDCQRKCGEKKKKAETSADYVLARAGDHSKIL